MEILRDLTGAELKRRKEVMAFFEFSIGAENQVRPLLEKIKEIGKSSLIDEEVKKALGVSSVVNFLDGMKFALGIIDAAQIRSASLSWIIGAEIPLAKITHPEIFESSIK